jgi:predicted DCC family thiol-disulfide oxidoreductase YuxK
MTSTSAIILFDGECCLCQFWVRFVVPRDPQGLFRFAPRESDVGQALARAHGLDPREADTVVLIEEGRVFTRSTAAILVARRLGWPWSWSVGLLLIPRPVRDAVYDLVARRRHRWFGRSASCAMLTDDARARFVDAART